ncbi:hypothetical protein [Streptomyces sp. NPDC089799]|uniref:hypothetical protein n=1 Tax=Streptomyces sp. NPDC089799 TaxID=3155066 RepID=UPI0034399F2E
MAEEFLDHDEFDALLQQQRGGRVPEVKCCQTLSGRASVCLTATSADGRFDGWSVWAVVGLAEGITALLVSPRIRCHIRGDTSIVTQRHNQP